MLSKPKLRVTWAAARVCVQPLTGSHNDGMASTVVSTLPKHDGQDGSAAPAAEKNRSAAKAEAKLNDTTAKPDKWVVNASILASMAAIAMPAIPFIEARKQKIEDLNASGSTTTAKTNPANRYKPTRSFELCCSALQLWPSCTRIFTV